VENIHRKIQICIGFADVENNGLRADLSKNIELNIAPKIRDFNLSGIYVTINNNISRLIKIQIIRNIKNGKYNT